MSGALRRLWGSLGFRLAFTYAVLLTLTLIAALGIMHLQTVGVMHQTLARQLQATEQLMLASQLAGGTEAVAAEIGRALADGVHSDSEVFLLRDPQGRRLAGNLDSPEEEEPVLPAGSGRALVVREGRLVDAMVRVQRLADGSLLVVGQDLREQESLAGLVGRASATAAIVALLLLVGGTFVVRVEVERSLAALRRTAARIGPGSLQERVDLAGEEDEFTLLKRDINAMLDRIESLMRGVRHVSDTIAHNLRTPLTRVLLRLRSASGAADAERRTAIDAAVRDLEDLVATFEKLLQIAEAESGTLRRQFRPLALDTLADDLHELYEPVAEAGGATLRRTPGDPAPVHGDRDLLAGALANLVDNALKYAGARADIRIGTERRGTHVLLTVEDDGPGVPAAERARLGGHFHRVDRSRPGHGLGLASVRAVVALHGGTLRFADAGPGLRIEIELPAA